MPLRETEILEISHTIACPFIEQWHYSGRAPTGLNIYFGWHIKSNKIHADNLFGDTLYAVADYGIGVNCYQAEYLSRITGHSISQSQLIELKRLCRIEPRLNDFPLTHFLSRCHKLLKRRGYRFVVTFSDPYQGHNGGLYKAANFEHIGQTNPEFHTMDKDGNIRHRRFAKRFADRKHIPIAQARNILGLKRIQMPPKDRWLMRIG